MDNIRQYVAFQKHKTNLDFTEARDSEWQWHQLGHMQVCTLLQTDNHASTHRSVFYRPDALPAAQPTASLALIRTNTEPSNSDGCQRFVFGQCMPYKCTIIF